jgi:hypothetical protein
MEILARRAFRWAPHSLKKALTLPSTLRMPPRSNFACSTHPNREAGELRIPGTELIWHVLLPDIRSRAALLLAAFTVPTNPLAVSAVPAPVRGTYAGLGCQPSVDYLKNLGLGNALPQRSRTAGCCRGHAIKRKVETRRSRDVRSPTC